MDEQLLLRASVALNKLGPWRALRAVEALEWIADKPGVRRVLLLEDEGLTAALVPLEPEGGE